MVALLFFKNKTALKNHKINYHVNTVLVGQSMEIVKRTEQGFRCPVCDKCFPLTQSYIKHMAREGIKATIPTSHLSSQNDEQELDTEQEGIHDIESNVPNAATEIDPPANSGKSDTSTFGSDMTNFPPSSLLPLSLYLSQDNRKRKSMNEIDTILDASDSTSASNDVKNDKIMLAKVGRWQPLIYDTPDGEFGMLTSTKTSARMLREDAPLGTWKSPTLAAEEDFEESVAPPDGDVYIRNLKMSSLAAKSLATSMHIEMTSQQAKILNMDWSIHPQLRYCCSRLLCCGMRPSKDMHGV
ncbi:hypothetical protein DM01DRAFT_1335286 [Hesseltinella vesiculosa]|uniref:Uncharacterized protein n=1 Tax=Hesseltinella vesiculosa TaxID=101127 RepID=A0A1X2GK74_9FUNG|nr:hypothetical protein DM01DRAFT_1335286 [Hesseltinella vesiculosa]